MLSVIFLFAATCPASAAGMDHSAHQAMMKQKNSPKQSRAHYQIPDVSLINQDGEKVNLQKFLKDSEPYALNFIFTTCTTICPILTISFSHMQSELGDEADGLQIISITIDPEYDSPAVLKSYAEKVGATNNWTFLTGDYDAIVAVEKAFDANTPDKMDHKPVYFFKFKSGDNWVRVDGLSSGTDLAEIYQANSLF